MDTFISAVVRYINASQLKGNSYFNKIIFFIQGNKNNFIILKLRKKVKRVCKVLETANCPYWQKKVYL